MIPLKLLTPVLFVKHRWLANKTSNLTRSSVVNACYPPRVPLVGFKKDPKDIAKMRGLASANER
jgi:hypothetical protein